MILGRPPAGTKNRSNFRPGRVCRNSATTFGPRVLRAAPNRARKTQGKDTRKEDG